jgi:hypothetical protein
MCKGADAAPDKRKDVAKGVVRADEHIDDQRGLRHDGRSDHSEFVWAQVNLVQVILVQAIGGSQAACCRFVRLHVEAPSVKASLANINSTLLHRSNTIM